MNFFFEVEELFTVYGLKCPESLEPLSVARLLSDNKEVDYNKRLSLSLRSLLMVVMTQIKKLNRKVSYNF